MQNTQLKLLEVVADYFHYNGHFPALEPIIVKGVRFPLKKQHSSIVILFFFF